ncbi:DNA repair protein RAD16 [Schizosaccharomyces japonicus yFS275]|uniref:DNA repair protein RAD16 n=1 Tax=Schizosaccharomyces japonicus (strain yFS275 / FY16936) TaxID=402676 RepID=B6K4Q1_SCHJY|nr:DNA repair protein RAD16 [Schizosaccharomyces japonicus yFS275]EEB08458.1 DNA repair protein RAD16 [Schizosaccharomyces japonicus yFS275]
MGSLESIKTPGLVSSRYNLRSRQRVRQSIEIPVLDIGKDTDFIESSFQDGSSSPIADVIASEDEFERDGSVATTVAEGTVSGSSTVTEALSEYGQLKGTESPFVPTIDENSNALSLVVDIPKLAKQESETAQSVTLRTEQNKQNESETFVPRPKDRNSAITTSVFEQAASTKLAEKVDEEEEEGSVYDAGSDVDSDYTPENLVIVSSDEETPSIIAADEDEDKDLTPVTISAESQALISDDDVPLSSLSTLKKRKRGRRATGSGRAPKKETFEWKGIPGHERTRIRLERQHPELIGLWERLESESVYEVKLAEQPKELKLQLLPFQREGLSWMKHQEESHFHGGILADEMGMGKTIQTISLLLSEPRGKPNLVVAPVVALLQWKSEIEMHADNSLRVYMFYGSSRNVTAEELKEYDVVLTSYNLVESVFRKQHKGFRRKAGLVKEKSLLHSVDFYRIILDEAHSIKSRSCNTAKAVCALQSNRRLCLSGTPLQNRIGELFSLLRFLKADPFAYYLCMKCDCKSLDWARSECIDNCGQCGHSSVSHRCHFNAEMLKPIQRFGNEGPGQIAFSKVHKLLRRIMLRRTKLERADDLGLPPRVVEVRRDLFNEEEEDLYHSLFMESKRRFNTYVSQGVVLNNYANIFQLITRMRQMADHPDLTLASKTKTVDVKTQDNFVCCICDEVAQDAIRSRCNHTFCRFCVSELINSSATEDVQCPSCFLPLSIDLSAPALEEVGGEEASKQKTSILNRIDMDNWRSSTKIEALVEELYRLRKKDRTIKSIVFSQFTSMLDLVHWRLRKAGFNCVKLEGGMTPKARDATIQAFCTDINITVFLVSLKAGGIALNLTEASQVFMLDPWWNGAVQWQAMDRIHRIGQRRPIRITTLCIENSIESKIIELQEKKAQMIHATIDRDEKALNQLTVEDMQFLFTN